MAMEFAFEDFLNTKPNHLAMEISKFLDKQLKKSSNMNEERKRRNIKSAMTIFKFLQAKDIFEAFYTQRLTKRLILEKSANRETETELI